METKREIVIVGAGPAGLSAALEAGRLGAQVLILDEGLLPGGQYFMQPSATGVPTSDQMAAGRSLIDEVREAGVEIWTEAQVWGLFPERRIVVLHRSRNIFIDAAKLIIATGAHDRTMAFPGWTLPGVFTPGGLQRLIKAEGVRPGNRAVVAGSGPLLLVAATQLLSSGVEIAAFAETTRPTIRAIHGAARFPEIWPELWRYLSALLRHRVPLYLGARIRSALGDDRLESVSLEHHGKILWIEADLLAVAQGFRCAIELSQLAGCQQRYSETEGGWICQVDRTSGETSVKGIYAAGEITGLAGWRAAREEGRIAALCAARASGRWSARAEGSLRNAQRRLRRALALGNYINTTFAPPACLVDQITDDTLVCRCEEVTAGDIKSAIQSGARTACAVKMWTRCAMGPCQGRICDWTLTHLMAKLTDAKLDEIGTNEPRVPLKPVALGTLLEADEM
jgi:thioredoxin reductase